MPDYIPPPDTWWVRIERDHGAKDLAVGPYGSHRAAVHALMYAGLIDGLVSENCLDAFVVDRPEPSDELVLIEMTAEEENDLKETARYDEQVEYYTGVPVAPVMVWDGTLTDGMYLPMDWCCIHCRRGPGMTQRCEGHSPDFVDPATILAPDGSRQQVALLAAYTSSEALLPMPNLVPYRARFENLCVRLKADPAETRRKAVDLVRELLPFAGTQSLVGEIERALFPTPEVQTTERLT